MPVSVARPDTRRCSQPPPGFNLSTPHSKAVVICRERLAQGCTNRHLLHRRPLFRWSAPTHLLSLLLEAPTRLCPASNRWSTVRLLVHCLPLLLHLTALLATATVPRDLEISLVIRSALEERICVLFDNSTGCLLLKLLVSGLASFLPFRATSCQIFSFYSFLFLASGFSVVNPHIQWKRMSRGLFYLSLFSTFGVCTEVARLLALV